MQGPAGWKVPDILKAEILTARRKLALTQIEQNPLWQKYLGSLLQELAYTYWTPDEAHRQEVPVRLEFRLRRINNGSHGGGGTRASGEKQEKTAQVQTYKRSGRIHGCEKERHKLIKEIQ